jgi:CRP-like cAMP-binding protein
MKLFEHIDPSYRDKLMLLSTELRIGAGETLFKRGDMSADMYRVILGKLEVVDERQRMVVDTLGPGQFVGEMAFVSHEERSMNVRAGVDTRVLHWSSQVLSEAFELDRGFEAAMYKGFSALLVDRLRATTGVAVHRKGDQSVSQIALSGGLERSARSASDSFKGSLLDLEEVIKREPGGPGVEAVLKSLDDLVERGSRVFRGLADDKASLVGELMFRELHPFLAPCELSKLIQVIGETGAGIANVYSHVSEGELNGDASLTQVLDSAILSLPTTTAIREREKAVRSNVERMLVIPGIEKVCVTPCLLWGAFKVATMQLGYTGGEICFLDRDSESLANIDRELAFRPKSVKFLPLHGDLLGLGSKSSQQPSACDLLIVDGLADYLPRRLVPELGKRISKLLGSKGRAIVTLLTPSRDQFLFQHLLKWNTVRHEPSTFARLLQSSADLDVSVLWKKGSGVVLEIAPAEGQSVEF